MAVVDDREVLESFAAGGVKRAFGPRVHAEGDALFIDGWWQAAFRVAEGVYIVRAEEVPGDPAPLDDLTAVLAAKGLDMVGTDLPAITALTYTSFTLGGASWNLWAADLAAGEHALNTRVTTETFFEEGPFTADVDATDVAVSAELGGARRIAGLPPSLVVGVGLTPDQAEALQAVLPDCQVQPVPLKAGLDACSMQIPTAIVVDATTEAGRNFCMELRASACGRFLPVAALSDAGEVPLGADAALDPAAGPAAWAPRLRELLP